MKENENILMIRKFENIKDKNNNITTKILPLDANIGIDQSYIANILEKKIIKIDTINFDNYANSILNKNKIKIICYAYDDNTKTKGIMISILYYNTTLTKKDKIDNLIQQLLKVILMLINPSCY